MGDDATRLGNYLHVLRELVHLSCGNLALEPRFDVKALLGDHLHDDARAVSKLHRRLYELGAQSGAPSEELAALLDRANDGPYLEIAYGELKPALVAALRVHLTNLDPLVDEPSLRLLTQLLHRQERHLAELPVEGEHALLDDLGALPLRLGEIRQLKVMEPLDHPARDAFVEVGASDAAGLHGLMDAELCLAELTARTSHEHPDMPWEFHADLARHTWDEIRHAEIYDSLMGEQGSHWGDFPVAFDDFRAIYALDLAGRLAAFADIPAQLARQRQALGRGEVFDRLRADEAPHIDDAVRWGTYLLAPAS